VVLYQKRGSSLYTFYYSYIMMDMHHCDCENCKNMSDEQKMMWKMKRREYRAMRALIALIVVIFVFWCGFEFGEIRASVGMMRNHGYTMMQNGGGMMRYNTMTVRPVIQATSTKTIAK
jgi:hypothetical protein